MKKILLTGSNGFIGSALKAHLCTQFEVFGVDNRGHTGAGQTDSGYDFTDVDSIKALCYQYRPDVVIHCAGIAHQKIGSVESSEYFHVNSFATETLAIAASAVNTDVRFIFLSSISVYGENGTQDPIRENDQCFPSSDYAWSKLDAERRLRKLFSDGILKHVDILRLAPVYDSEWSLNLERRVFAPGKFAYVKFGDGNQKMSVLSRQNLASFISHRLNQDEFLSKDASTNPACTVFNVCDRNPSSFCDIINVFRRSQHQPDRIQITVPLGFVWGLTQLAALIFKNRRQWLHSCYDKLSYSLVFDNTQMLMTGFVPPHTLESVFLSGNR
ncbi:NAD-dependent epimerase/dehydratase family protein [Desulfoluna spongiiphila]|uniref:Nucleoside-diphosphate-sugar epimerase n=1 Tax=Desulfoluna spongiiphila TaxID=419481 RepID=A0A1G5JT55_9BACT|nr:NAD-dependent epimerase/dehydratase family protein [Desulfoluna spongiiphila]SCY91101.1 Nucleoside-diphosphate-sugar epimerase [Desulfoluna spongiiphila]